MRQIAAFVLPVFVLLALAPIPVFAGSRQGSATGPSQADIARWRAYHDVISVSAARLSHGSPLTALLAPVLQRAEVRARATDANLTDELRAALLVTAFYVNGWPLGQAVPAARGWPPAPRRTMQLRGRHDLAQHFAVSALIAGLSGTPLANLAGLYKEMRDARGGSGFSFSDLAADRAGATFGDLATRSAASAQRLLLRAGGRLTEEDLMPVVTDLPDNLNQAEFDRRFGGVTSPQYVTLVNEINRRVADLRLFQED